MAKELNFTYEGKDYTLGFSKNTIRQMESNGFVANEINDKPATVLPVPAASPVCEAGGYRGHLRQAARQGQAG